MRHGPVPTGSLVLDDLCIPAGGVLDGGAVGSGERSGYTRRYVVLSSGEWNEGAWPQCVPVQRGHGVPEIVPYVVLTNEADPVSGALDIGALAPLDPTGFVERVGMLTGSTMAKLTDCLRYIYEL